MSAAAETNNAGADTRLAILDLVCRLRIIRETEEQRAFLRELRHPVRPIAMTFVNAHAINLCRKDAATLNAFRAHDVALRDGSGLRVLLRMLRLGAGLNMNGTDFIPRILDESRGLRIALWGTREPFLGKAARKLSDQGHTIVSLENGFHDWDYYAAALAQTDPDLVILAMGMPRQEKLALHLRAISTRPRLIISGGAILDFLSGRFTRAPHFLRSIGLEWAYRLALEPTRLFARYVVGNVTFLIFGMQLVLSTAAAPTADQESK